MKRLFFVCLIIFAVAGFFSCASAEAAASGGTGSSVWKITRDGETLFLGGSAHVLREEDFPLPVEFDQAFAASSMLALEADIERMSDDDAVQYLMARIFLPEGETLSTVLDSDTYALLMAKCGEYGITEDSIAQLKPSMVMNTLAVLEMQEKQGFEQSGVDMIFLEKAKEAGMPVDFLETVESQIDLLTTMAEGYENDYVKYSLQDMDNTETELNSLVSSWRSGDADYFTRTAEEMNEMWPVLYQSLLVKRNAAWMPRLEEYLATEPVEFVITGVMHMHGPDGLLRQLEDLGCTVEQLR